MIGGLRHSTCVNWKMKHNRSVSTRNTQAQSCPSTNTQSALHSALVHSTRQCACTTHVPHERGTVTSTSACAPWGKYASRATANRYLVHRMITVSGSGSRRQTNQSSYSRVRRRGRRSSARCLSISIGIRLRCMLLHRTRSCRSGSRISHNSWMKSRKLRGRPRTTWRIIPNRASTSNTMKIKKEL